MKEKPGSQSVESYLRRYARGTQLRLIVGGLFILLVVGNGLIRWIYGASALWMSLLCSLAGLAPIGLIILFLWVMERIVERDRRD